MLLTLCGPHTCSKIIHYFSLAVRHRKLNNKKTPKIICVCQVIELNIYVVSYLLTFTVFFGTHEKLYSLQYVTVIAVKHQQSRCFYFGS